jgi:hypothetical protein
LAFEHIKDERRPPKENKGSSDFTISEHEPGTTASDNPAAAPTASVPPRRSPITSYALSRKSVIDRIGGQNKKYAAVLLATRTGMAATPDTKNPVWRPDMGDVLLQMLRRQAADALISRAAHEAQEQNPLLQPCKTWEDVKEVPFRGCALWLPSKEEASTQYATLDVEGAAYGQKLAVHNMRWLLGESELERLKAASNLFHDNEILVLPPGRSKSLMSLHLLLWRLQGYLAQPTNP